MTLDRLLGALDVSVVAFAVCDLRTGTSLDLAADGEVEVHYVLRGAGELHVAGRPPVPFGPRTVLIVPAGLGHRFVPEQAADGPGDPLHPVRVDPSEGLALVRRGEDERQTLLMVCGVVRARIEGNIDLFGALREPLVVDCSDAEAVGAAFEAILREEAAPRPGSQTLVSIGMTTVFVHVLRQLLDVGPQPARPDGGAVLPWLAALGDERMAAALAVLVDHPERPHTLESLASVAGMSRSAFADHFHRTFESTPMDMLRELRVRRAAHLLRSTDLPVKLVASRVGYASRSQFSRAFKGIAGVDPSSYRAADDPPAMG